MTLTSEVAFTMLITWLPVGGTMNRMACGTTIRRSVRDRLMPSAAAASDCPGSTASIPARMISAMYAASFSPRPSVAASSGVMIELVLPEMNDGPNGMPIERRGSSAARLYQKISCTSTGVPRKNQM